MAKFRIGLCRFDACRGYLLFAQWRSLYHNLPGAFYNFLSDVRGSVPRLSRRRASAAWCPCAVHGSRSELEELSIVGALAAHIQRPRILDRRLAPLSAAAPELPHRPGSGSVGRDQAPKARVRTIGGRPGRKAGGGRSFDGWRRFVKLEMA